MKSMRKYLWFGTFPVVYLAILAILCGSFAGCAGSKLTDAYNVVNAVSATRNGLQPIYAKVVQQHPELKDEIVAFDAEMHKGIASAYEALIAIKAGNGTFADYQAKIAAIVGILERYDVGAKVPELKPGIDLIKKLLGVV